jgi:hypothetical protein
MMRVEVAAAAAARKPTLVAITLDDLAANSGWDRLRCTLAVLVVTHDGVALGNFALDVTQIERHTRAVLGRALADATHRQMDHARRPTTLGGGSGSGSSPGCRSRYVLDSGSSYVLDSGSSYVLESGSSRGFRCLYALSPDSGSSRAFGANLDCYGGSNALENTSADRFKGSVIVEVAAVLVVQARAHLA